jgi:4-hydroxy-2-oxoheptanedioate aldolase
LALKFLLPNDESHRGIDAMTGATEFTKKLKSRLHVAGIWMEIPHPTVAGTLAQTGVDFLVVDGEHGPIPPHILTNIMPEADNYGMPIIYRVAWNRPEYIKAALDTGANGVMVPMVNSPEEAAAAVAAAKYPPAGTRGIGAWRASNYYQNEPAYRATANDKTIVIVQIETVQALQAVDAIAAVPGVDVIFIGPGDLALSRGNEPGVIDVDLLDACKAIAAAAQKNGILAGIDVSSVDHLEEFVRLGLVFFTHRTDFSYMLEGGRRTARAMREIFDAALGSSVG